MRRRHKERHVRLAGGVLTLAVAVVCAAVVTGPAWAAAQPDGDIGIQFNCGTYPANQSLTRDQIMQRARSWIDEQVPYSQSACHTNQYGSYRTDCSGMVSMAWGLKVSYDTSIIRDVATAIARAELAPGDMLWRRDTSVQHAAIFVRWADDAHTKPVVWQESGPDGVPANEATWSASYANTFTPFRYDNLVDGPPAPPLAHVRSVVTAAGSQEFGIGPDGHVMSTFWSASYPSNGGWLPWFAIPTGYADGTTAPNATVTRTMINGNPQLFTIAPDHRVISTFWSSSIPTNGGWHEWFAIPTGFYDGTTARNATVTATYINGMPQLFTTAPDGHVMSTFWSSNIPTNGGWHDWFAIPTGFYDGTTTANATVTATTINGMPQLFTTAPDGHVMSTFWSANILTNGGWHDWFAIPTGFSDGRAAGNATVSMTMLNGMPQLFTTAPDGHVMSTFWSANILTNGGWHDWFAIGTGYADGTTGPNASVSITVLNGMVQLFTTATNGHVISTFWSANIPTNGGWHDWFAIPTGYADGSAAGTAWVSVTTLNGMTQLFTAAPDGHVISTFWSSGIPTNGGWHDWFAIPTGFYDGTTRL